MRGSPATRTSSPKVTLTAIVVPARYAPVAFGDETDTTSGRAVSSSMPDVPASVSPPDRPDKSRSASLPASSLIVPPLRDRADAPV